MNSANPLSIKKPPPDFMIHGIPQNMKENRDTGWYRNVFYFGRTSFLDEFLIHAGVLSAHVTPHPPHCHKHEELHIALSENLEFVLCEVGSDIENAQPIDKGSLFFTDSNIPHSFRNTSAQPAAYLHFRWMNESKASPALKKRLQFYYSPSAQKKMSGKPVHKGLEIHEIYSGPSLYLPHFRVIFMRLLAGGVIPYHRHSHEVIFVLVSGSVEILGRKVDAPGFAFMGTQVPHPIINHGPDPAQVYAFELHQKV